MLNYILLGAEEGSTLPPWVVWVVLGGILLIMLVLPMFTRKKQANMVNDMLNAIRVGDRIKTVGGIIGTVVRIDSKSPLNADKEFVIETGEEFKCQLRLDSQAILMVVNKSASTADSPESARIDEQPASEQVEEQKPEASKLEPTSSGSSIDENGDYKYQPNTDK